MTLLKSETARVLFGETAITSCTARACLSTLARQPALADAARRANLVSELQQGRDMVPSQEYVSRLWCAPCLDDLAPRQAGGCVEPDI